MMLYPNIINIKKSHIAIKILSSISVVLVVVCYVINKLLTPQIKWSFLVTLGIIYIWITVLYSIRKNLNIASHVLLQTIIGLVLTFLVDEIIGYRGWSINIGMPIIICIANMTMLVLTIVSRKKYFKYGMYQIILSTISILVIILLLSKAKYRIISVSITSIITAITLILSIVLCGKDLKEKLYRIFHI